MKKSIHLILFVVNSVLIAGLYGVLHNQVTYSISNEYFTHFKFLVFGLPDYYIQPHRLGAAIVGWTSSWWFGLVAGLILGSLWVWENILALRDRYFAIGIVVITAIVFGALGGIFSYFYYQPQRYYEVFQFTGYTKEVRDSLNSISNPYAFLRAGVIHNSSYIGGTIGLILGALYLNKARHKSLNK